MTLQSYSFSELDYTFLNVSLTQICIVTDHEFPVYHLQRVSMSGDAILNATAVTGIASTVAAAAAEVVASAINATLTTTTQSPSFMVMPTDAHAQVAMGLDPLSHVGDGIFLQTKTALGIAGAFVWVALFLTCQQVSAFFIVKCNL